LTTLTTPLGNLGHTDGSEKILFLFILGLLPVTGRVVSRLDRKRFGQDTFTTKWNLIRGVFDEQTRRKPLVFAADAVRYRI